MKPIIGISGNYLESIEEKDFPKTYTPQGFVQGIQVAGGAPFIIPIGQKEDAKLYIENIDGLILAGGQDVSPVFYHEEPVEQMGKTNLQRDIFEMALVQEAARQKKPIFAVCRGMQLLNVAFGGTLYQDIDTEVQTTLEHNQLADRTQPTHPLKVVPQSLTAKIFGEQPIVNSLHHQAVNKLAANLCPVAWSSDGLVEAVETRQEDLPILAVQWHPEFMLEKYADMAVFFKALIDLAKEKKTSESILATV